MSLAKYVRCSIWSRFQLEKLLFVPILCLQNDCNVVFDHDKCVIQDKKTLKMIGLVELIEGLYYLTTQAKPNSIVATFLHVNSSTIIPKEILWNFRLGHLSNSRLLSMHHIFPYVNVDHNYVCDICPYAKHRKLKFSLSSKKAQKSSTFHDCLRWT